MGPDLLILEEVNKMNLCINLVIIFKIFLARLFILMHGKQNRDRLDILMRKEGPLTVVC